MEMIPEISGQRFGGGSKVKQGPVEVTLGTNSGMGFEGEMKAWESQIDRAVGRYRRLQVA